MSDLSWIKLDIDMFSNPKIKKIRRLPEGNNILLIWVMLLTMAGRCNSCGMIFITQNIPYTLEDLADELGFSIETTKLALRVLSELGMIRTDEAILEIPGWYEHQNEGALEAIRERDRKRQAEYRAKKKQQLAELEDKNNKDNLSQTCHRQVTGHSYSYSLSNSNNTNSNNTNNITEDNNIDITLSNIIKNIITYLNNKTNSNYRSNTNKTITCIKSRLREGFTEEDFYKVIDEKSKQWMETDMEKFLRPETLFGTKFESYLNEALKDKEFSKDMTPPIEKKKPNRFDCVPEDIRNDFVARGIFNLEEESMDCGGCTKADIEIIKKYKL